MPINRLTVLGRSVASVLHQVNNQLQVISGTLELVTAKPLSDELSRRLARIQGSTQKAATAVDDLLRFARGGSEPAAPIEIASLLERAIALVRYQYGRASIAVSLEVSGSLPHVHGHAAELQQALLNLLLNAQQALASSPRKEVTISAHHAGGEVVVSVSDSGPSIEPVLRERIFDPFFTTHHADGSAGLGLPAARLIAERHGGRLTLADGEAGSTFVLALPARAPSVL